MTAVHRLPPRDRLRPWRELLAPLDRRHRGASRASSTRTVVFAARSSSTICPPIGRSPCVKRSRSPQRWLRRLKRPGQPTRSTGCRTRWRDPMMKQLERRQRAALERDLGDLLPPQKPLEIGGVVQRVCGCASNGMHWFNPTTRASSDQLRTGTHAQHHGVKQALVPTVLRHSGERIR